MPAKTVMYVIDSKKYFEGLMKVLKKTAKGKTVIYVTTNKPYKYLMKTLKDRKIDDSNVFFIDCISDHIGDKPKGDVDNCFFVSSPKDLTSISITVNESIKGIKGDKILFLDSLSALLMYNDSTSVGKFSNFIINKMRSLDVDSVILALESDIDKDVIKRIESFADEVKNVE